MNMKKNKKNQILVAGTMAFDEIITKSANSGRVIGCLLYTSDAADE